MPRIHALMAAIGVLGVLWASGSIAPVTMANVQHGSVNVAYAGSLEDVNNLEIGPAFEKATGDTYQGQGGGSFGVAHEIASHAILANVFESIGYAPIQVLEPKDTDWAFSFAASPLVVAYNPHSPFAGELNAIRQGKKPLKDLFLLMAQPNFHLGRTNPNTDPQGQAFAMMVQLAIHHYHLPPRLIGQILGPLDNPHEVYSEEGILTLLQSGGLDASSAFLSEAKERHLDYISLPPWLNFADPKDKPVYHQASLTLANHHTIHGEALTVDITTVGKPTPQAIQFIRFVLGPQGARLMRRAGYTVFRPQLNGQLAKVPASLRSFVR
ncbi:MAG: extracellular solute-binding protein [Firmicutes bacterium]|nr:extracellular solute-binding protein [Bacillota bacterium]